MYWRSEEFIKNNEKRIQKAISSRDRDFIGELLSDCRQETNSYNLVMALLYLIGGVDYFRIEVVVDEGGRPGKVSPTLCYDLTDEWGGTLISNFGAIECSYDELTRDILIDYFKQEAPEYSLNPKLAEKIVRETIDRWGWTKHEI